MAEIDRLKEIVETLRSENGCPWDRVRIPLSLLPIKALEQGLFSLL